MSKMPLINLQVKAVAIPQELKSLIMSYKWKKTEVDLLVTVVDFCYETAQSSLFCNLVVSLYHY